jgi:hypothetical protein
VKFFASAILFLILGSSLAAEKTNLVQQIDANTLRIGAVRLEKSECRLLIPATVNMVEGPIEYVLVSALGKLHESIFKTFAEPIHIQTGAMLLLRETPSTNDPPRIQVSVEFNGKTSPAESTIDNIAAEKQLTPGTWRYSGSRLVDGTFIAQRDGSIISIIADPDSIIQSGRVSAEDDENWRPRKSELPPVGTPVKIVLQFPAPEKQK